MEYKERNRVMKVIAFVEWPFSIALKGTIPGVEAKTWSRTWNAITLVGAPHVFFVAADLSDVEIGELNIHWVTLIIGPVLAGIAYWFSEDKPPTNKWAMAIWMIFAVTMACVWPMALADELVDCLGLIGIILGISAGVLGVTILAMGNSMPDYFADMGVAKRGYPRMAAAGCIGSPLFNLLVGVGAAFTIVTIRDYPEPYEMSTDEQGGLGFIFLFISLGFSLILLPILGFRLTRRYGFFLIGFYFLYLLFAVLTELNVIPPAIEGGH